MGCFIYPSKYIGDIRPKIILSAFFHDYQIRNFYRTFPFEYISMWEPCIFFLNLVNRRSSKSSIQLPSFVKGCFHCRQILCTGITSYILFEILARHQGQGFTSYRADRDHVLPSIRRLHWLLKLYSYTHFEPLLEFLCIVLQL